MLTKVSNTKLSPSLYKVVPKILYVAKKFNRHRKSESKLFHFKITTTLSFFLLMPYFGYTYYTLSMIKNLKRAIIMC